MDFKRISILCGHYGSGKTNVAVNLAMAVKASGKNVVIADLDIVNPYFRTKDSEEDLKEAGIRLICSEFANSNVDLPSLPQEIYSITDDKDTYYVLDVGGDERGALALGRLAPAIIEENNYDMFMVVNMYRPLTRDADATMEVLREIEEAAGIRFTGIINNSNLAEETTPETVTASCGYANEISLKSGLKTVAVSVKEDIADILSESKTAALPEGASVLPLQLQKKPV